MNLQQIEVVLTPDGKMTVHVRGVKGPTCDKLFKGLEDLVGRPDVDRKTEEYQQAPAVRNAVQRG